MWKQIQDAFYDLAARLPRTLPWSSAVESSAGSDNPYPSLFNRYNGTLCVITILSILGGGYGLYKGNLWFIVPFVLGTITLLLGLKQPSSESSRKVWLVTFLGQMTTTKVDKLSLFLDWIPGIPIIGYVEIDMQKIPHDFVITKPIRCLDRKYVEVTVSTTMVPDESDDHPDKADPKSGGQKLKDSVNAGKIDGVKTQLLEILTVWIQYMAKSRTTDEMEQQQIQIADKMLLLIKGEEGTDEESRGIRTNSKLDDTRGFGTDFPKFQVIVKPPQKVVDARNEVQVKEEKRRGELVVTETMDSQIEKRYDLYRFGTKDNQGNVRIPPTPLDQIPSLASIRNMILQENLAADGKVSQNINEGGINVINPP